MFSKLHDRRPDSCFLSSCARLPIVLLHHLPGCSVVWLPLSLLEPLCRGCSAAFWKVAAHNAFLNVLPLSAGRTVWTQRTCIMMMMMCKHKSTHLGDVRSVWFKQSLRLKTSHPWSFCIIPKRRNAVFMLFIPNASFWANIVTLLGGKCLVQTLIWSHTAFRRTCFMSCDVRDTDHFCLFFAWRTEQKNLYM